MILVVGATGLLGGMITRHLLATGSPVRILVRPQSNYQPLAAAGAQAVQGDLKERVSLDAACQGVDTVITTANSAMRGGLDNPETVEVSGNRNLIAAARAAGVKQFIFVSASGADPRAVSPFLAGKGVTEQYLKNSGLTYTIIAPGPFTEIWMGMVVAGPIQRGLPVTIYGPSKQSFVSMVDVMNFTVAAIDHPAALNQRLVIGGPEPFSFADAANHMARLIGRDVPVVAANLGEPIPGVPDQVLPMMIGMSTADWIVPMDELAETFNIRLTPIEATLGALLSQSPTSAS